MRKKMRRKGKEEKRMKNMRKWRRGELIKKRKKICQDILCMLFVNNQKFKKEYLFFAILCIVGISEGFHGDQN